MFYLFLSLIISFLLIISIIFYFSLNKKKKDIFHYFIIVKDGEVIIESVIRSLNFRSFLQGKEKKITVFDLGSKDDTLEILKRFTYQMGKIDNLHTLDSKKISNLEDYLKQSLNNNEKPVIIYINTHDDSPINRIFQNYLLYSGETS